MKNHYKPLLPSILGPRSWLCITLLLCPLIRQVYSGDKEKLWYTRYPHYPAYCSTPEEMATRKIPELPYKSQNSSSASGPTATELDTKIVHATAIMRHGARTPWGNDLNCWEDYWTNSATAIWDCDLTAYLSPPPPAKVTMEGADAGSDHAMFLFEKRYDALPSPWDTAEGSHSNYLSNYLSGTCQVGQLLLQGYSQELVNGKYLREAYLYTKREEHNPRMRLLNAAPTLSPNGNVWDHVHFRSDDEARTLMSGQVILRGLMGKEMDAYFANKQQYPVIRLHTADYDQDIVAPNEAICPRLAEIREAYEDSMDFRLRVDQTHEANTLRQFQKDVLRVPLEDQYMPAIECLMTTICNDRPLPDAVNDFRPDYAPIEADEEPIESQPGDYGEHLFSRLVTFDAQQYTYNMKANDAEYAKLGMGPLWFEIMEQIQVHLRKEANAVQLSVFSGHDTTVMPLLASLDPNLWDDKDWAPYASMIVLEIHEVLTDNALFPSKFAFRLVYNGNVLTNRVTGCPSDMELCDSDILVRRIESFATLDADCERQQPFPEPVTYPLQRTKELVSTPEGVLYLVLLVGVGVLVGAAATCLFLTGCSLPRCRRRGMKVPTSEEDGIALTSSSTIRN